MSKKAGFLVFMLLVIPIISAVPVFAGNGQIKQEFVFHMNGENIWVPEATYITTFLHDELNTLHVKGEDFVGVFSIEIGPSGTVETILDDYIEYTCELKYNFFFKTYAYCISKRGR